MAHEEQVTKYTPQAPRDEEEKYRDHSKHSEDKDEKLVHDSSCCPFVLDYSTHCENITREWAHYYHPEGGPGNSLVHKVHGNHRIWVVTINILGITSECIAKCKKKYGERQQGCIVPPVDLRASD
mmetsp:Transcript_13994/g.16068  ORF Transcript_13994/g.16068 Transcript_13994/m.16068 type:complete len:125 (-) Transcript_13994:757-1131(-)